MTWTKTGTDTYLGSSRTSGQTAATLSAGTVGDLRVILFLHISSSLSVSSLSGGGVTTWTRAGSVNAVASTTIGVAANAEIWYGKITSTATALTIAYSGTVGSTSCRLMQRDFRTSRAGTPNYSVAATGYMQTSGHATSSPLTWPSLTTKGTDELVVGCMGDFGGPTFTGTTAGYTYTLDADGNQHIYRLSCGAAETEAAQSTFSGTDGWYAHQAIFDDGLAEASVANAVTATAKNAGTNATSTLHVAGAVTAAAKQAGSNISTPASKANAITATAFSAGSITGALTTVANAVTATAHGATVQTADGPVVASVAATAFNARGLVATKPERRRYTVPPEVRTISNTAESRKCSVPNEQRTITVTSQTAGE